MKILTEWRIKVYPRALVAAYAITTLVIILGGPLTGKGLFDLQGKPLGSDFLGFWTAASLVKNGHPDWAYSLSKMHAVEKMIIGPTVPGMPWLYPPTFLLVVWPLAYIPYPLAIILWIAITMLAFVLVVNRIAPHPLTPWLILAFPGTFQNLIHFQNGFLSAALLGGGLLLMSRSPVLGGVLLGLLSYKPHLAVLIPIALIAGRHWRTLAGAAVSASALALATLPVMGWKTWAAFLGNLPLAEWMIRHGVARIFKMPTTFAGALLAGAGFPAAYVLQGIVTLVAVGAVIWVWSQDVAFPLKASALALAILLATPYAFEYDLAILALPLAWLAWEGYVRGWLWGEQNLLLIGYVIPLLAPILASKTGVQIAPLVLGALLLETVRRIEQSKHIEAAWTS
jgi:alpha-1,2-mannosyltransferase